MLHVARVRGPSRRAARARRASAGCRWWRRRRRSRVAAGGEGVGLVFVDDVDRASAAEPAGQLAHHVVEVGRGVRRPAARCTCAAPSCRNSSRRRCSSRRRTPAPAACPACRPASSRSRRRGDDAGHQDRGFSQLPNILTIHPFDVTGNRRLDDAGRQKIQSAGKVFSRIGCRGDRHAAQELGGGQALAAGLLQPVMHSAPSPQATITLAPSASSTSPGVPAASMARARHSLTGVCCSVVATAPGKG